MKMSIDIEGLAELDGALGELKLGTQRNVLRRVGRQALLPMRERAQALAPDDPTTPSPDLHTTIVVSPYQRSGRQRGRTREGVGWVNLYMGPSFDRYPREQQARAAIKATVGEFGSVKASPHPYMRPAFEACKEAALAAVRGLLGQEIAKAAARAAKKAKG